jgi:hypothetical protein
MREFIHYATDRYRAQRLAKFQKTRCEVCVAKLNEEQRLAAASVPKKGEAFKMLPAGAQFTISRTAEGWSGTLTAQEKTVEASGESPHGVSLALARAWLSAMGIAVTREEEPPAPAPAPAPAAPPRHPGSTSPRPSLTNRPVAPKPKPQ